MKKYFLTLLLSGTFASALSGAEAPLGEKLEVEMWENMKHHNWTAVENTIAPEFRSTHWFGSQDRQQELDLIKKLYLGSYKISDLKTAQEGDTITVTYWIAVNETINEDRSTSKASPRLSVWKKINDNWQWIAHANLNPFETVKANSKSEPKKTTTESTSK